MINSSENGSQSNQLHEADSIFEQKFYNMKRLIHPSIFAAVLLIGGCIPIAPVSTTQPKNNIGYDVDYLFEHDGCKVYRFSDRGNYVYFTNCRGETSTRPDSTTLIRNRTEKH